MDIPTWLRWVLGILFFPIAAVFSLAGCSVLAARGYRRILQDKEEWEMNREFYEQQDAAYLRRGY